MVLGPLLRQDFYISLLFFAKNSINKKCKKGMNTLKSLECVCSQTLKIYSYKIVSSVIPDFNKPIVWYRGPDAAEIFVHELQREAEKLCGVHLYTPRNEIYWR